LLNRYDQNRFGGFFIFKEIIYLSFIDEKWVNNRQRGGIDYGNFKV